MFQSSSPLKGGKRRHIGRCFPHVRLRRQIHFARYPEIQLAAFQREQGAPDIGGACTSNSQRSLLDKVDWSEADIESRLVLALYVIEAAVEKARPPAIRYIADPLHRRQARPDVGARGE